MMTDAPPQSGMQTFDQALYKLYAAGEIDYDVAISSADSPNDLRLMIKMGVDQDSGALDDISNKLSLEENFEDDRMTMR